MSDEFFIFIYEKPNGYQAWSPYGHPRLFQVGYMSGTINRIQQCSTTEEPTQEMKEWARQAESLGLTPFIIILDSSSPFADAWRNDPYLSKQLMGNVEMDFALIEDSLAYPEDDWLNRHLALCGKEAASPLSATDLPRLDLLIPFSDAYRSWRESLDPDDEDNVTWIEADPSAAHTVKQDWLLVKDGVRNLLVNSVCPMAYIALQHEGKNFRLRAEGILSSLPNIAGVIPSGTDDNEIVVNKDALDHWLLPVTTTKQNWWWNAFFPQLSYAALALIFIQGGVIAYLLAQQRETPYSDIRSPTVSPTTATPSIIVNFQDGTSERDMRMLLIRLGAKIVAGPSQLGDYEFAVEADRMEETLAELRKNSIVLHATIKTANALQQGTR